jgi:N-formylglutamate amidohydrolase
VTDCFEYYAGTSPLLISIPHDGRTLPPAIRQRMTGHARELPDTDWHVCRLYEFSKSLGVSIIAANYSRYVVDLNRADTDEVLYKGQFVTGLCPEQTFAGEDIYVSGEKVSADEKRHRIESYWRPYHDQIASSLKDIRESFGYALLWDAHSIPSQVPLLFDGELPELNFGTNDGRSCVNNMIEAVIAEAEAGKRFSTVLDGRFKGGYITRQYGDPANDVYAIQLELAQRCYMIEASCKFDDDRASQLQGVLSKLLLAFISSAESRHNLRSRR